MTAKDPIEQEIEQAIAELERKGLIKKKRDEHGNVVVRPGKDGTPQPVWVVTNVIPLRWES